MTYTFPTQQVLSGSLSFEVKTSVGSGTVVVADKYFSDEVVITNETEFLGGDLQSASATINIDYDKNGFFRGTILPIALTVDGWVFIKITLEGDILFYGKVEPTTITYTPFYATNDALDEQRTSIEFRCIWGGELTKLITKKDLADRLLTTAVADGKYVSGTGSYLVDGYTYVTLEDIIQQVFYLLNSTYGITYHLSFSLGEITFYSKGDSALSYLYSFPNYLYYGNISNGALGQPLSPCLIHGKVDGVTIATGKPSAVSAESGTLFYDSADSTFINAYDFFVGILKSFGLYCEVTHNSTYDMIVKIGQRVGFDEVNINDVLTSSEIPMSEVSRSKINVTSKLSGNAYVKEFPNIGTSEFSYQLPLDYGNDLDFCGGSDPVNSIKSLCMPFGNNTMELIRYAGLGQNQLVNQTLYSDINGWTVDSGSWVYNDTSHLLGMFGARATLDNVFEQQISQTLTSGFDDGAIFGGRFFSNYANVNVIIRFYSGANLLQMQSFRIAEIGSFLIYSAIPAGLMRNNPTAKITLVTVSVQPVSAGSGTSYIWMNNMFFQRSRKGTPEFVGLQLEDLFNNAGQIRKNITLNGVQKIKPSNYFIENGVNFYLKKVEWQLRNHETVIEAINYPY